MSAPQTTFHTVFCPSADTLVKKGIGITLTPGDCWCEVRAKGRMDRNVFGRYLALSEAAKEVNGRRSIPAKRLKLIGLSFGLDPLAARTRKSLAEAIRRERVAMLAATHDRDADCTLVMGSCALCGVSHSGDQCQCGGYGFHRPGCTTVGPCIACGAYDGAHDEGCSCAPEVRS